MTGEPTRITTTHLRILASAILGGALLFAIAVPIVLSHNGGGLADRRCRSSTWFRCARAPCCSWLDSRCAPS
ncbi:MAG: hypothetical protein Fur0037_12600 [Planctomycetota bacterium]